jgi:hypothetical protein
MQDPDNPVIRLVVCNYAMRLAVVPNADRRGETAARRPESVLRPSVSSKMWQNGEKVPGYNLG